MELQKTDWFYAQAYRDDGVGQIAKLWIGEKIDHTDESLENWLAERETGLILREQVIQANQEFKRAKEDIRNDKRTPTFPRYCFKVVKNPPAWEYHKKHPEITVGDHLSLKRTELSEWLSQRKIIYLDTCHWLNLRKIVLRQNGSDSRYESLLGTLRDLISQKSICCPISIAVFRELMKQSDDNTRMATAELMDELSLGVCLPHLEEICRLETNYHIGKRLFPSRIFLCKYQVWTKPFDMLSAPLPQSETLDAAANTIIQKVFIDVLWDYQINEIIEELDPKKFPHLDYQAMVDALKKDASFYQSNPASFEEILDKEKVLLFQAINIRAIVNEIVDFFIQKYPVECAKFVEQPFSEFNPNLLASLEVMAGINATFVMNPGKITPNDLLDALHSAFAIPYCDVFACDRAMSNRLKNTPLNFDQKYKTKIVNTPDEIEGSLK